MNQTSDLPKQRQENNPKGRKSFRVKGESNLRFMRRDIERDGLVRRVSILQEKVAVVYDDGTEGMEFIDVRSFSEPAGTAR